MVIDRSISQATGLLDQGSEVADPFWSSILDEIEVAGRRILVPDGQGGQAATRPGDEVVWIHTDMPLTSHLNESCILTGVTDDPHSQFLGDRFGPDQEGHPVVGETARVGQVEPRIAPEEVRGPESRICGQGAIEVIDGSLEIATMHMHSTAPMMDPRPLVGRRRLQRSVEVRQRPVVVTQGRSDFATMPERLGVVRLDRQSPVQIATCPIEIVAIEQDDPPVVQGLGIIGFVLYGAAEVLVGRLEIPAPIMQGSAIVQGFGMIGVPTQCGRIRSDC